MYLGCKLTYVYFRDGSGKSGERRGRGSDRKRQKSTSGKGESDKQDSPKDKKDLKKGCKSKSSSTQESDFGEDSQGELFSDKFVIPRVSSLLSCSWCCCKGSNFLLHTGHQRFCYKGQVHPEVHPEVYSEVHPEVYPEVYKEGKGGLKGEVG